MAVGMLAGQHILVSGKRHKTAFVLDELLGHVAKRTSPLR